MGRNIENILKLQIGCGQEHLDDHINMDISDFCNPDIQWDIRKGFPMFGDDKFERVTANGVLEMVHPNEEFLLVMNELWRVISKDGALVGQVPSTDPRVVGLDPFDKRWFKEETFNYWTHGHHCWEVFGRMYGFKPWNILKINTNDNGIICFTLEPHK